MSWLARSLANSLRLDDDGSPSELENDMATNGLSSSPSQKTQMEETEAEPQSLSPEQEAELQLRGVKEDLTELRQTLACQIWGIASFLAPPPVDHPANSDDRLLSDLSQPDPSDQSVCGDEEELLNSAARERIRGDFSEIGKSLSKVATDYFSFGSMGSEGENKEENASEGDNEEFCASGVTDEVLAFARNIAHHPETWLDFPLDAEDDLDDFKMSNAQQGHTLAIESLAPRLAALRTELCPCHLNETYFWKVYFVLLHSRLNKHDAEILSTPQVMEARAMWMKELQKKTKQETDFVGRSMSYLQDNTSVMQKDYSFETMSRQIFVSECTSPVATDCETESTEVQFVDKSVIEERLVFKSDEKDACFIPIPKFEEDNWPEEELEYVKDSGTFICLENEDISFSDLEDVDDGNIPVKSKIVPDDYQMTRR